MREATIRNIVALVLSYRDHIDLLDELREGETVEEYVLRQLVDSGMKEEAAKDLMNQALKRIDN